MDTRLTPLEKTEKKISTSAEVALLEKMTVPQLRARHAESFGEPARSHHRGLLVRQIAGRLQVDAEGGLTEETRQLLLAIAREAAHRVPIESAVACGAALADRTATTRLICNQDVRVPMPGSLLIEEHKGETHVVKLLDNGFDDDGLLYRSLSAIAQEITGTKWNKLLFFGIAKETAHGRR